MLSVTQYSQIAEATHTILNPFPLQKLLLLGEICEPSAGDRHLDLASGKGELVCQFAARHGTRGVGVEIHEPFLADARARAHELGVEDRVEFVHGDAGHHVGAHSSADIVSCIGATWIGGGLAGTVRLMRQWIDRTGWLLVGEPYWIEPPPPEATAFHGDDLPITDLEGTLDVFETAGTSLVEMVLASQDDWDRYSASQWLNVERWLESDPGHALAAEVRNYRDRWRRQYLAHDRRYLGWGVFVLRPTA